MWTRLGELGAEPWLLSQALVFVSAQRLVRKLCGEWKKEVPPPQEQLLKAGVREDGTKIDRLFVTADAQERPDG